MAKFLARHIAPEMLALLLLEAVLSFMLAYAVGTGGDSLTLASGQDRLAGQALNLRAINEATVVAFTVGFTSIVLGLYRPQLFLRARSLLLSTALGGLVAFPAVWAVMTALGMRSDWLVGADHVWPLKMLLLWTGALFSVRIGMLLLVRSRLFVRRVALLDPAADLAGSIAAIRSTPGSFLEVTRPAAAQSAPAQSTPAQSTPAQSTPAKLRAAGVRVALATRSTFDAMAPPDREAFALAGVDLVAAPAFWERRLKRVDIDSLTPAWFARLDARPASRLQPVLNRAGDILLSFGLLVFTMPLMAVVALAVRLDSRGPVLYRQERVGLGGRPFIVLKFRSMRLDAEAHGPAWAQQRDPRVTRVGSFMRRTRIDELPQLINVLQGRMSFIGPRPERPHFVEQLAADVPYYQERSRVKPGLTGWAQVNYPYGASVEDARAKLSYDLYYVRHRSVLLDLSILVATVRVILFQEGSR